MQQTLNFNSRQIISREELKLWDLSLRNLPAKIFRYLSINGGAGILDRYTPLGQLEEGHFITEVGSIPSGGYDTIQIGEGWGVFRIDNTPTAIITGLVIDNNSLEDSGLALFYWPATDNIDANIGAYSEGAVLNVGFAPVLNPMELGVCSISTSGQVTIVGGDFNKLRDQSFKNPTKVRFYNEDGTPANNNQIYEVVQKVNSTQMIISGVVVAESNIRMVIVGAYDLGVYGDLEDKIAFPTVNGQLVITTNEDDIINAGGFIVSELHIGAGGTFSIVDVRQNNVFNFALPPDAVLKSVTQEITGQKTFSDNSPIFNIPVREVYEPESLATPLTITFDVSPANKILEIPAGKDGSIYTVRANVGNDMIGRISFEAGYTAGTKFYLQVDPSGEDLIFLYSTSVIGSVKLQNLDYGTTGLFVGFTSYIVKKGAILELLALPGGLSQWLILNTNPLVTP